MQTQTQGLTKGLASARSSVANFGSSITNLSGSAVAGFAAVATGAIAAAAAVYGLGKGISSALQLAAAAETTAVSFEVLLGSVEAANEVMANLNNFAASTPFEFPEIAASARNLIAFGLETKDLIPTLTSLGDVAAGLNIPFNELSEIYGKIKVSNTVFNEDLNQLQGRGIPIVTELAKQFGVTQAEIKEMSSKGQIEFADIERAFQSLTGEGGKFSGLMQKQSQTLSGVWSTAKDNFNLILTEIGTQLAETFNLRGVVTSASSFFQSLKPYVTGFFDFIKQGIALGQGYWQSFVDFLDAEVTPIWVELQDVVVAAWDIVTKVVGNAVSYQVQLFQQWGQAILSILPSWQSVKISLVTGLAAVEYVLLNASKIWKLWQAESVLSLSKTRDELIYFLDVANYVAGYIGRNWRAIFTDLLNFLVVVFENMGNNLAAFVNNLPDIISGNLDPKKIWQPLTEGFKTALTELPNIPKKQKSFVTDFLEDQVNGLRNEIGTGFNRFVGDRLKELLIDPLQDVPKLLEAAKQEANKAVKSVNDTAKATEIKNPFSDLAERGSQSARDSILRFYGVAARQKNPNEKLEKGQKEQTRVLKDIARAKQPQLLAAKF